MNAEKLKKLQANVRIGGKGTPRRKHKVQHKSAAGDDKKLQANLKRLGCQPIQGIEEVTLFKDDGKVIHFSGNSLKVQAAIQANTYVVSGTAEEKTMEQVLPNILSQLGGQNFNPADLAKLQAQLKSAGGAAAADDDVPDLVENFDAKPASTDAKPAAAPAATETK